MRQVVPSRGCRQPSAARWCGDADHRGVITDMAALIAPRGPKTGDGLTRTAGTQRFRFVCHALGPDLHRDACSGYPLVGRLRRLAELRGILKALDHPRVTYA